MTPIVYLASSSPRRQQLLAQLGVGFEIVHPHVDESQMPNESAHDYVARLALDKARAGRQLLRDKIDLPVVGADTCIVLGEEIIGKPRDKQHCVELLVRMSGTNHWVYSSVAIIASAKSRQTGGEGGIEICKVNSSEVFFRDIGKDEAECYWRSGEPRDKAGGYAIQGLGAVFVSKINGSYSGIMGLPLFETAELLKEVGINVLRTTHCGES